MAGERADVVMFGPKPIIEEALTKGGLQLHKAWAAPDQEAFIASIAPKVRAIAAVAGHGPVDGALMARFPKLEIVSSLRRRLRPHRREVGRRSTASWSPTRPDVLNEEVADTALGLLLCTVRHLPQAERYLRAGNWPKHGDYQLTPSLRDRTVGIVGMGRIGKAIARRLDAMQVPVVYHTRRPTDVPYRHYPEPRRHGARRRRADRHHAGRRGDEEPGQRRRARGARAERHPDQRGARLGGRRGGADQGAAGQDHPLRRPRRVRRRAERAGRS